MKLLKVHVTSGFTKSLRKLPKDVQRVAEKEGRLLFKFLDQRTVIYYDVGTHGIE